MGQNFLYYNYSRYLDSSRGGVIADVIANRVPLVFSSELYITVCFWERFCILSYLVYAPRAGWFYRSNFLWLHLE